MYIHSLDGLAQEALDLVEKDLVFLADKGNRFAALALRTGFFVAQSRASACGAADAVDVVLGITGHVVVDYQRDVVHVDAARHNVCRDEDVHLAGAEVEHYLVALFLIQVRVHLT